MKIKTLIVALLLVSILTTAVVAAKNVTIDESGSISVTKINSTKTSPEESNKPGFEAIFAIAGLLAVAFLVRRN